MGSSIEDLVRQAITRWAEDTTPPAGWRHVGYKRDDTHCAAWAEGLLCCIDPEHPEFDNLIKAITDALRPVEDARVTQVSVELLNGLRAIADLDTAPHSPNSAGWRACVVWCVGMARKLLEPYGGSQPQYPTYVVNAAAPTDRTDLHDAHVVISKSLEVIGSDSPHDLATWVLDHLLEAGWDLVSPSQSLEDTRPASRQPSNDSP